MSEDTVRAVIRKCGGVAAIQRALGFRHRSTVTQWIQRGSIPARRQADLLAKARECGWPLSAADFFDEPTDNPPTPPAAAAQRVA